VQLKKKQSAESATKTNKPVSGAVWLPPNYQHLRQFTLDL